MLVDGSVDEQHLTASHELGEQLTSAGYGKPGRTGLFGGLTFSHDLVHLIGGQSDTNANTTRRTLLLFESAAIGQQLDAHTRVVTQLIRRYVEDDFGYRPMSGPYVPGFLLNDIVRFWRTMAVDFAAKRRERAGEGWALRRFKLRMSRKLTFAAGLAICLGCKVHPPSLPPDSSDQHVAFCDAMTCHLLNEVRLTPLEVLARLVVRLDAREAGKQAFDAYDEFLAILGDQAQRQELEQLSHSATETGLFERTNDIARSFSDAISRLFFESNSEFTEATKKFGIF